MAAFSPLIAEAGPLEEATLANRETLHIFQPERRNIVAQVRRRASKPAQFCRCLRRSRTCDNLLTLVLTAAFGRAYNAPVDAAPPRPLVSVRSFVSEAPHRDE
jgi:hypothetical protein